MEAPRVVEVITEEEGSRKEPRPSQSETSSVGSESELLVRSLAVPAASGPLFGGRGSRSNSCSNSVTALDDDEDLHVGDVDHFGRRPWHPRIPRWRRFGCCALVLAAFFFVIALVAVFSQRSGVRKRRDLFVPRNEKGYEKGCFRIPALLAVPAKGRSATGGLAARTRLLAFAEGRRLGCKDAGFIDVVVKISDNGGRSWGPLRVVATAEAAGFAEGGTIGNPAPIYDALNDRVVLLLTANRAADSEPAIISRLAADSRHVFALHSADRGESWSAPRNITSTAKRAGWTWYATGAGIQLRSGRLVAPCNHVSTGPSNGRGGGGGADQADAEGERDGYFRYASHALLSDDGGANWRVGGLGASWSNEATVAELPNADVLLLNARQMAGAKRRIVMRSVDGGESWGHAGYDDELVEPGCQGSLVALPKRSQPPWREGGLLFSNPHSANTRTAISVSFRPSTAAAGARGGANGSATAVSGGTLRGKLPQRRRLAGEGGAPLQDGGGVADAVWRGHGGWLTPAVRLWDGPSAYSAMTLIGEDRVGVLFENGRLLPTERISFTVLTLDAFAEGRQS